MDSKYCVDGEGSFIRTCAKNDSRQEQQSSDKDRIIAQLQAQLDAMSKNASDKDGKITKLEKENRELQCKLAKVENQVRTAIKGEAPRNDSPEGLVGVLEQQALTYKEDFECERRDRERLQSRLADVELELSIVKRELHQYNLREMQNLQQRRKAALDFHRQEYERKHGPSSVYQNDSHMETGEGEDEVDF